jgi:hypothetical protein
MLELEVGIILGVDLASERDRCEAVGLRASAVVEVLNEIEISTHN